MSVQGIRKAIRLLEEFRKLDQELQMQAAVTFLLIAEAGDEGIRQLDLQNRLGMSQASASRNVALLTKVHWRGPKYEGHDLVAREEDPNDRRNKIVRLTARGRRFLSTINNIME
jgi:DNA-binding MarR family transcriptional regulator